MERYVAAMTLGAVGDAIGHKSRSLALKTMSEFEHKLGKFDTNIMENEFWPVSDITIAHLATSRALTDASDGDTESELNQALCRNYVGCLETSRSRICDSTFKEGCARLRPGSVMGWHIPFDAKATGSGAAARAMCIGLRYSRTEEVTELIEIAVEAGRMTHNHPLGFTGSVCTALFVSFAIQAVPIVQWGRKMLNEIEYVKSYCTKTIRHTDEYSPCWFYFETKWKIFLKERTITQGDESAEVSFPEEYGPNEREKTYGSWSSDGRPGGRGHDAPMIAYDALLACSYIQNDAERWKELCSRAMIHSGQSDATGSIAGFLYGILYGFAGVPETHRECIEFHEELINQGERLYELQHTTQ